jgi:hypothetical protein
MRHQYLVVQTTGVTKEYAGPSLILELENHGLDALGYGWAMLALRLVIGG